VGLSLRLLDREHCIDFNLKKAKEAFGRVPIERQKKPLTLFFSQAGGDDLRRVGEWYQGQWKKNLGIEVRLESRESKTYLALLSEHPPEIFRKGFSLDRPSCEAAVEAFISGAPNNLIRQHSDKYDRGFEKLQAARTTADKKRHCGDLMEKLISNYRMIPQGRIHFSMLQNHRFEGWKINSLNQLDLTQLHLKK
jgi:oligopeptide transport system substrate-binding protein